MPQQVIASKAEWMDRQVDRDDTQVWLAGFRYSK